MCVCVCVCVSRVYQGQPSPQQSVGLSVQTTTSQQVSDDITLSTHLFTLRVRSQKGPHLTPDVEHTPFCVSVFSGAVSWLAVWALGLALSSHPLRSVWINHSRGSCTLIGCWDSVTYVLYEAVGTVKGSISPPNFQLNAPVNLMTYCPSPSVLAGDCRLVLPSGWGVWAVQTPESDITAEQTNAEPQGGGRVRRWVHVDKTVLWLARSFLHRICWSEFSVAESQMWNQSTELNYSPPVQLTLKKGLRKLTKICRNTVSPPAGMHSVSHGLHSLLFPQEHWGASPITNSGSANPENAAEYQKERLQGGRHWLTAQK